MQIASYRSIPASLAKKSLGWEISAQRRGILSNAVNTDCNLSNNKPESYIGRLPFDFGLQTWIHRVAQPDNIHRVTQESFQILS